MRKEGKKPYHNEVVVNVDTHLFEWGEYSSGKSNKRFFEVEI